MKNLSFQLLEFIENSGYTKTDEIIFALSNVLVSFSKTQNVPHELVIKLLNEMNLKQDEYDRTNAKGMN